MSDPILILAQPRSGSSMTAGIFHRHGVWVGSHRPGDQHNAKGHYENIALRTILVGMHSPIVHDGTLARKIPGFREQALSAIKNDGYVEGPWLWKGSVMYHPAWFEFDALKIGVIRPRDKVFQSCRRSHIFGHKLSDEELYANIDFHQTEIRRVCSALVFSDEVAKGDFESIRHAIETAGLEWNEKAARDFVDRDLWHY